MQMIQIANIQILNNNCNEEALRLNIAMTNISVINK